MKKHFPQDSDLARHIDHYWIVNDAIELFKKTEAIYAYPGVTPEMIIILDGSLSYFYKGKKHQLKSSKLVGFINEEVILDTSKLKSFIIVQFKPRVLASMLPFINISAIALMENCICEIEEVFDSSIHYLVDHLKKLAPEAMVPELDQWFSTFYKSEREGFITEMVSEFNGDCSPKNILEKTNYSYSTLERHFKKETGLTPKKFHSLQRYKLAVEEIYDTSNSDWMHYVQKYGYFDQSHFIKEIKKYTTFTPTQLIAKTGLRSFRPENI